MKMGAIAASRRRGGGGSFLPSDLATLRAWYDADSLAGSDGARMTSWADRSGNGYTATTISGSGARLQYNQVGGRQAVYFDADDVPQMTIASALLDSVTAASYIAVFKRDADPPAIDGHGGAVVDGFTSDDGSTRASHTPWRDGVIYEHFGTSGRITVGDPTPSLATPRIYSACSQTNNLKVHLDGSAIFAGGTFTGTCGTKSRNLGWAFGGAGAHYLQGHIAEVCLFATYLTDLDRQKLEGYLAHKWGLASNLPSGHPYKSAAP